MKLLGLDIGTNSVGSAWVDTDARTIRMGVSVFPAGVEQSEDKRGAPKNQARRSKRSLRRSIHRRALRKWRLRELLVQVGEHTINGLSGSYFQGGSDKPIALMGSGGRLEVSISGRSAAELLGLSRGDGVVVRWR